MRTLLSLSLALLVSGSLSAEDKPRTAKEQPIKIVPIQHPGPVVYQTEIEPIFVNKCIFCHSGNIKEGKFDISSYETLMKGGKRGKAIVAGKADQSLLYILSAKMKRPFMAPKTEEPLTPEELALIKLWIDQGAKPPTGPSLTRRIVVKLPPTLVKPVRGIAISPDKSMVASSRGNIIHIYDANAGTHIRSLIDNDLQTEEGKMAKASHISLVESLAFSPDGKFIASGSFREIALWDAQTGMLMDRIEGFAHMVVAIAFSPDGKFFATGGGAPTEDGEIKVFETATGKLVKEIPETHSDTVYGVCFSPDGTKLVSCGADKFVKAFEVSTGKFLKSFEGHTHHVLDVGWRGDGKYLASAGADNVVKIWDFEKGEQVRTVNAHKKQVTRLKFVGKSNSFLTCSGDQTITLWNSDNGGRQRSFTGSGDYLYAIGVSPDGQLVASGGEEGNVRLYRGNNGQLIKVLAPPGEE